MCAETADNVLLPSVQVARVNRREAKRHGGRPHGVFEVVPNAITSQVPPDPDPGDDMLLERSANNDHTTGQAIGKPRTRTQPCQTPKHRAIQGGTENGLDTAAVALKNSLACVRNSGERTPSCQPPQQKRVGASPAVSSNPMSATTTKQRADTAVSSTLSGKPPHDKHRTAFDRNPRRERRQSSQTPRHRTTPPQQQSTTRADTAVSSNSRGNPRPSSTQR